MSIDPITMEIVLDYLAKNRYQLAGDKNFESYRAPMSTRIIAFLVEKAQELEKKLEENKDD